MGIETDFSHMVFCTGAGTQKECENCERGNPMLSHTPKDPEFDSLKSCAYLKSTEHASRLLSLRRHNEYVFDRLANAAEMGAGINREYLMHMCSTWSLLVGMPSDTVFSEVQSRIKNYGRFCAKG